jgi:hypothetical protein
VEVKNNLNAIESLTAKFFFKVTPAKSQSQFYLQKAPGADLRAGSC